METIVAAACQYPMPQFYRDVHDGRYPEFLTVSAPPPARHHHLLHPIHDITGYRRDALKGSKQGFLTSTGRFVEREEALQIAVAAGQPLIDHPSRHATQLFSEDLW